jgi:hypothetical protein
MKLKPIRRLLGLLVVGDGIRAFVAPEAYVRGLQCGTPLIDDILDYVAENRRLTLRFSMAEIAIGLWLTFR